MDFKVSAFEEQRLPDSLISWRICFHDELSRENAMQAISNYPAIKILKISSLTINDNDWAIKSQDRLRAIRIGNVVLAPPWDGPLNPGSIKSANLYPGTKDPLVVVIQPSMGFGTGHHPTTRLSLWALQQLDLHKQTLIDVGTGQVFVGSGENRATALEIQGMKFEIFRELASSWYRSPGELVAFSRLERYSEGDDPRASLRVRIREIKDALGKALNTRFGPSELILNVRDQGYRLLPPKS